MTVTERGGPQLVWAPPCFDRIPLTGLLHFLFALQQYLPSYLRCGLYLIEFIEITTPTIALNNLR